MKTRMGSIQLCKGLPTQLIKFADYIRGCRNEELPKYDYLRLLLSQVLQSAEP
jgi:hypothetical protein